MTARFNEQKSELWLTNVPEALTPAQAIEKRLIENCFNFSPNFYSSTYTIEVNGKPSEYEYAGYHETASGEKEILLAKRR